MTVKQLRDSLNNQIELGRGDASVSFDVEAGAFDTHLVEVNAVSYVGFENDKTFILHTDEPIIHSWKEI